MRDHGHEHGLHRQVVPLPVQRRTVQQHPAGAQGVLDEQRPALVQAHEHPVGAPRFHRHVAIEPGPAHVVHASERGVGAVQGAHHQELAVLAAEIGEGLECVAGDRRRRETRRAPRQRHEQGAAGLHVVPQQGGVFVCKHACVGHHDEHVVLQRALRETRRGDRIDAVVLRRQRAQRGGEKRRGAAAAVGADHQHRARLRALDHQVARVVHRQVVAGRQFGGDAVAPGRQFQSFEGHLGRFAGSHRNLPFARRGTVEPERHGPFRCLVRVASHAGDEVARYRRPGQPVHAQVALGRGRHVVEHQLQRRARSEVREPGRQGALLDVGDHVHGDRQFGAPREAVHRAHQLAVVQGEGPGFQRGHAPPNGVAVQRRFLDDFHDAPGRHQLRHVAGAEVRDHGAGRNLRALPALAVAHGGREVHDDDVQAGGLGHQVLHRALQSGSGERQRQQHQHADAQRQQQQVLQLLRQHPARLAGFQEHHRTERLPVGIGGREPVQPDRHADGQESEQECRRQKGHRSRLCRNSR